MGLVEAALEKHDYLLNDETSKAKSFMSTQYGEVIYLLPNKTEIAIVIHPKFIESFSLLDYEQLKPFHSTALKGFPKRLNSKTLISYGYSYKCKTEEELESFLAKLNDVLHSLKVMTSMLK